MLTYGTGINYFSLFSNLSVAEMVEFGLFSVTLERSRICRTEEWAWIGPATPLLRAIIGDPSTYYNVRYFYNIANADNY